MFRIGVSEFEKWIPLCSNREKTLNKIQFREFWKVTGVSLMAQVVKNLPAMQETTVQSLDEEDSLGEGNAWRIPWTEESGGLYSSWVTKSQTGQSD